MFICPKKILMALLFMLLAAPVAFQTVRAVLGGWISTAEGLPKIGGLAVHAAVFIVLSTLIWRYVPFGSSNFEGDEEYRRRCYKRNKRTGKRREVTCKSKKSSKYEGEDDDEEVDEVVEDYEDEDFRRSRRSRRRSDDEEEYNQPDPSKMHSGIYH